MRRRWTTVGIGAGLVTLVLAALAGPAGGAASAAPAGVTAAGVRAAACGSVTWGSAQKLGRATSVPTPPVPPPSTVRDVRTGRQPCYDRLVVALRGTAPAYLVRYVTRVTEDGSGRVVPVRGGARLQVTVFAPAYDDEGDLTYVPANRRELTNVTGYRTFRQVAWAGTFEGNTDLGLGVRARLPFRVLQVAGPGTGSRLVVDVAHTW